MTATSSDLISAAETLRERLRPLRFGPPVTHVYDPLEYAWAPHTAYLRRFGEGRKKIIFLGMNPGPYGMAQTGVPFGEIPAVRDWMGICEPVSHPVYEHPKRPVEGFACRRSEVSGRRLWGWARDTYGAAENFFRDRFVVNYCPLIWLEDTGRNRTPDKIPPREMAAVHAACDAHLRSAIEILRPEWLVGVGGFAEARFRAVAGDIPGVGITRILHPSPASPAANRDWSGDVTRALEAAGLL